MIRGVVPGRSIGYIGEILDNRTTSGCIGKANITAIRSMWRCICPGCRPGNERRTASVGTSYDLESLDIEVTIEANTHLFMLFPNELTTWSIGSDLYRGHVARSKREWLWYR
jgi:hypothetical protein